MICLMILKAHHKALLKVKWKEALFKEEESQNKETKKYVDAVTLSIFSKFRTHQNQSETKLVRLWGFCFVWIVFVCVCV